MWTSDWVRKAFTSLDGFKRKLYHVWNVRGVQVPMVEHVVYRMGYQKSYVKTVSKGTTGPTERDYCIFLITTPPPPPGVYFKLGIVDPAFF